MTELDYREKFRRISELTDDRDYWIAKYARDLIHYKPLERFRLTPYQRRVIAGLRIQRELAELGQDERVSGRPKQPPPVMGYDERDRVVVQQHAKGYPDNIQCWALGREGQPIDIKGDVKSLKDGRVVRRAKVEW